MARPKKTKEEESEVEVADNETIQAKIKRLKQTCFKGIELFVPDEYGSYDRVATGIPDVDAILGGGLARGSIVELYGPEQSGKTWLLTKLYAECCKRNLPFLHIDAEQSFSKSFAEQNGVDLKKMTIVRENVLETLFKAIEASCESQEFAVIGIDSLAALMTNAQDEKEMGEKTMGSIAGAMSTCLPKLAPAIKKGNVLLVFINQLRQTIGGYAPPGMPPPEHTPGGKTLKYFASTRIDVRMKKPLKSDRPDMYEGDKLVGHILKIKVVKAKTHEPNGEATCDLWYKPMPETLILMKQALEDGVLISKSPTNGKKITYKGDPLILTNKNDYGQIIAWLREREELCEFLVECGVDDFERFVTSGELTQEEVTKYLGSPEKEN